jgi:transaldolase/glucose-6-phosphate isomerase
MANPLVELQKEGQSVWYDNIRRGLISSGELKRLIDEDGVLGVTSNPAIFEKAIGGGNEYDAQIKTLLRDKPGDIFEKLAVQDIRDAADVLAPVYKATDKRDGYISMEVFPELANDTQGSIEQARKLWQEIDKPNLMIKIPATPAGIPAIEQLISEGINVNVTLIFAVDMYRQVMDAYLKGLERRSGDLTGIASVASFFISRVDSEVDKRLEGIAAAQPDKAALAESLYGKAAIANAKLAYQAFKETFAGQRFDSLRQRGAAVQRPLWASTGTKNPKYSDVLYVEEIVGRDTVNTMPPATVSAFKDHGEVEATIEQDVAGAQRQIEQIEQVGVPMAEVTQKLLDEGVKLFVDAFDTLMSVISAKRDALRDNIPGREEASLGGLQAAVNQQLAALAKADTVRKLWNKDSSVFGKDKDSEAGKNIRNRLGWLHITDLLLEHAEDLERFAQHVKDAGFKRAIFCGSAGINPAVEMYAEAFGSAGYPQVTAMHAGDVEKMTQLEADTLVIHAGKKATVAMQQAAHANAWKLRPNGDQYVLVTDAESGLVPMGAEHKFRRLFMDPGDVAGEYGALSFLGLVAAAVAGADVTRLLNRSEHLVHDCLPLIQPEDNAGAWFGAILAEAHKAARTIAIVTPPAVAKFGQWAAKVAARGGVKAEAMTSVGLPSSYGQDRLFVYERLGHDLDAPLQALKQAGQPVVTLTLRDRFDLGEEIFRWEFGAAIAGSILGINVFEPPATH